VTVIDLLHHYGYRVCEFRKVKVKRANGDEFYQTPFGADGIGMCDLIAINREKKSLIVIENKRQDGQASKEQIEWLKDWSAVCDKVYILKPDDYEQFKNKLEEM
jgi:hypothetical protein